MLTLPPPEPLALLQAAAADSVSAGLASLPQDLRGQKGRHVVMLRSSRRVFLLDNGNLRNAFPVAVGMPGWETPTGRFEVLQKIPNPVWVHPVSGERVEEQGPDNPLGSHWIAFHRDCLGRDAHDGEAWITIKGCTTTGFHGTPHRWTVGRAVSHGCVRLYNEDVSALYRQVSLGTQVTVLP
ncbi:L,D-transpeptidase [Synechococcus sp. PROS-U-1]|uniref:L,D-transpeptidase n=1 Tax=Synechococcus sp. PROS-U-1 TaxID=1400866 RepID=UPI00164855F9|nr:L,D-transpeptidase [Synechococcus sp. PROS-U-1]QNJ02929.1 L/D-transpeptidase catalytic domain protein [Synechococcus sp. PROS-U-1]